MTDQEFEAVLKRMPRIAEAVNAFNSEAVQTQAFDALLKALGADTACEMSGRASNEAHVPPVAIEPSAAKGSEPKVRHRKREGGGNFKVIKELDLRPQGKVSFEDFVADKQPATNEERYAVAVYYLEQILGVPSVTENHVGTVFRLTQTWREPSALAAALRMTATRKGTIDTSDHNNIRTTPTGRNFVEHDLPAKPKSK